MLAEFAVPIVDQILAVILHEHAFIDIGDIAHDLCHPFLMRIRNDSSDVDLARTQMDEEQDVIHDQAEARPHFRGKEIGSYRCTIGTSMWLRMNSLQVVSFFRSPTGGKPCFRSTFPTVVSLTRYPRFFRAPEIRSYPWPGAPNFYSRGRISESVFRLPRIHAVVQETADIWNHRTSGPPV